MQGLYLGAQRNLQTCSKGVLPALQPALCWVTSLKYGLVVGGVLGPLDFLPAPWFEFWVLQQLCTRLLTPILPYA